MVSPPPQGSTAFPGRRPCSPSVTGAAPECAGHAACPPPCVHVHRRCGFCTCLPPCSPPGRPSWRPGPGGLACACACLPAPCLGRLKGGAPEPLSSPRQASLCASVLSCCSGPVPVTSPQSVLLVLPLLSRVADPPLSLGSPGPTWSAVEGRVEVEKGTESFFLKRAFEEIFLFVKIFAF